MSDWQGWYLEVESRLEVLNDRLVAIESLPVEDKLEKLLDRLVALESRAKHNHDRLDALEDRLRALEMQIVEQQATNNTLFNTVSGRLNSLEIVLTSLCETAGRLLHLLRSRERAPGERGASLRIFAVADPICCLEYSLEYFCSSPDRLEI